jgi:hypothetical protein
MYRRPACRKSGRRTWPASETILSSKIPVSYKKARPFEKNTTMGEKKKEFMIAGIKQICTFVAVKKQAWTNQCSGRLK